MDKFETRLKELRTEKGISQKALAWELGTTDDSIFSWEKGRSQPSIEAIKRLADFFEVSTDYLLGRADDLGNITIQSTAPALTGEEAQLLDDFRRITAPNLKEMLCYSAALWSGRVSPLDGNSTAKKKA